MLERLNADLSPGAGGHGGDGAHGGESGEALLLDAQEELKATKRQRIRDIMKHPEQEAHFGGDLRRAGSGPDAAHRRASSTRSNMPADKRNTIIQVNRAAKTAMEVFDDILSKDMLDRKDLQLIIEKIKVYEDHLEIQLKADIDSLLRCGDAAGSDGGLRCRHGYRRRIP